MFLKGKLRAERYTGDLVFADIVEASPNFGFQRVRVSAVLYFTWNRFLKKPKKQIKTNYYQANVE